MNLGQDLRYAFRTFAKSPGLVAAVVVSIGLGVAANSTVFSVVNSLMWGSLPVREPDRLVSLGDGRSFSYLDYIDFHEQTKQVFENGVAANCPIVPGSIGGNGEPERIWGQLVTGNYWQVAGAQPMLGRGFTSDEDRAGGAGSVVVLGNGLWRRRFGGDTQIVGKKIVLNGGPFEVVGVAPPGFQGTLPMLVPEFWLPMGLMDTMAADMNPAKMRTERGMQWLMLNARLKPGVTRTQAQAAVNVVQDRINKTYRKKGEYKEPVKVARVSGMPGAEGQALIGLAAVMMVVVALVLLIACANVANLLLARAAGRQKEIGIRLALGASRSRLVAQLLTESVVLALAGGAFGLVLAFAATRALSQLSLPFPVPLVFDFTPDWHVLAFTAILAILTGIVFGLAPAIRSTRSDLVHIIKQDSGALGSFRRFGLRNVLVVTQVAISLVLLVGATLFIRSLRNASSIDLGMKPENVLMMTMDPKLQRYSPEKSREFLSQVRQRVTALPGVTAVTLLDSVPLSVGGTSFDFKANTPKGVQTFNADVYNVGSQYFEVMGIPLVRGRDFDRRRDGRKALIINETMAQRFFDREDPVGRQISTPDGPVAGSGVTYDVVGVAKNSKSRTIGEDPTACAFMFLEAAPEDLLSFYGISIAVKSSTPPRSLERAIRDQIHSLDANMPVHDTITMQEHVNKSLLLPRLCATLLFLFGGVGLVLATVGLYGVISYSVRSRVREIGIRMALGAESSRVSSMVTAQALALIGVGLVIGLGISFALTRFVASLLYGLSATDAVTFIGVPIAMVLVGLAATAIPARRAARIEPMEALRYE